MPWTSHTNNDPRRRTPARMFTAALAVLLGAASITRAEDHTIMIQYFEATWNTMRYRMPDVFMAGYNATWLPPPQLGGNGADANSIGYDLFDRFNLGSANNPTRYGTESDFRLLVDEFHRAHCRVFVDWIMNHNANLDNFTPGFLQSGGYPGFVLETPSDPWGDFHPPGTQSENPGGPDYDLFNGRLVNLIDIAQEKNHLFIRHPIAAGDPNNVPAGTITNLPNAANRRFYPDQQLPPFTFTNPGTTRNPGAVQWTVYPFNVNDPAQGDPVIENAAALLLRSTQYYLEVLKVDGFRLDAAKHIPTWFWDNLWDSIVYQRWRAFDGTIQTPFSFVEAVGGGGIDPYDWTRKHDGFGNRDALDLDEAGALRDQVDSPSSRSWADALNASIDNRDFGLNNGSLGVHHVSSHDNANSGVNLDTTAHAYVLMRSGPGIVYHNAQQFGISPNNFPRRHGRDDALGLGSDAIVRLVRLRNQFVRGRFDVLNFSDPVNQSLNDILIMQHSKELTGGTLVGNVVIGVNDLQTNGQNATDQRWVQTAFAPGTRLHEQTGNASNPVVDVPSNPNDDIAEVLTTDVDRRILIKVPRNRNSNGVNHGRGYVVYAPAVPSGTLTVTNVSQTIPPDPPGTPNHLRRLTPIDVITADTFEIVLTTTQTDPLDPNTDDLARFRIDRGFVDYNGNGAVDDLNTNSPSYGYENFLTQNAPLYLNPGAGQGQYRQVIDAAALGDGLHYVSVMAFRHRSDAGDPIFAEFRKVLYVDRVGPSVVLESPTNTCSFDVTSDPMEVVVRSPDNTADRVHVFLDFPATTDFEFLADAGEGMAVRNYDTFSLSFGGIVSGNHRIDILAYESLTGQVQHQTFTGIQAITGNGAGPGDLNGDGRKDGADIRLFLLLLYGINPTFSPPADMNCDGLIDSNDLPGFVQALLDG